MGPWSDESNRRRIGWQDDDAAFRQMCILQAASGEWDWATTEIVRRQNIVRTDIMRNVVL